MSFPASVSEGWERPRTIHRGYTSHYTVQYTGSQRDRFGVEQRPRIQMMLQWDEQPEPQANRFTGQWYEQMHLVPYNPSQSCPTDLLMRSGRRDFPRVADGRLNLTALSHYYNLYFVAYMGWCHVYIPNRTAKGVLDLPVAVLDPAKCRTQAAAYTSGLDIPGNRPHVLNHMMVGGLGEKEVLLIAREDGDVAAWYTDEIARQVEQSQKSVRRSPSGLRPNNDLVLASPSPFFKDNCGRPAWGLAIHRKSRLFAVSTLREVTVFAFALKGENADAQFQDWPANRSGRRLSPPSSHTETSNRIDTHGWPWTSHEAAEGSVRNLEQRFRTRRRGWRIVIPMGPGTTYRLPSISFCEDEAGNADRVAALDNNGALFIAQIWSIGRRHVWVRPHNVQHPEGLPCRVVEGCNVLPITDAQLLPTSTLQESIGVDPSYCEYRGRHLSRGAWLDIYPCMIEVDEDAARDAHGRRMRVYAREDRSAATDGLHATHGALRPVAATHIEMSAKVHEPVFDDVDAHCDEDTSQGDEGGIPLLTMTLVPPTGEHFVEFETAEELAGFYQPGVWLRNKDLPYALTLSEFRARDPDDDLLRGVSFLRANREDVEMLTLREARDDVGIACHYVLAHSDPYPVEAHLDMRLEDMRLEDMRLEDMRLEDMRLEKRCSMLLTIPELNMVILGAACGRVALLTLTKPYKKASLDGEEVEITSDKNWGRGGSTTRRPRRAFRVDAVLPFKSEDDKLERPLACLLGIAVSPIPESTQDLTLRRRCTSAYGGRRRRADLPDLEPSPPRRWRLLLNYMDHTILQYEIAKRKGQDAAPAYNGTAWERRMHRWELDHLGNKATRTQHDIR